MVEKHVKPAYHLHTYENRVAQRSNAGLKWLKSINLYCAFVRGSAKGTVVRQYPIHISEIRVIIRHIMAGQHDSTPKAGIEQRFPVEGQAAHRHPNRKIREA